jgi:hypothetical protein
MSFKDRVGDDRRKVGAANEELLESQKLGPAPNITYTALDSTYPLLGTSPSHAPSTELTLPTTKQSALSFLTITFDYLDLTITYYSNHRRTWPRTTHSVVKHAHSNPFSNPKCPPTRDSACPSPNPAATSRLDLIANGGMTWRARSKGCWKRYA